MKDQKSGMNSFKDAMDQKNAINGRVAAPGVVEPVTEKVTNAAAGLDPLPGGAVDATGLSPLPEGAADSGPKWTREQLAAISERNCSLLVAAAAGAGKTAVLVERIIRRITDSTNPVDIDRMLIVTFTNAAATEMRERISEAISKELDRNPASENLRRQSSLLGKASIMTIHSFCRDVIKKHIESTELDPGFRVADDTESTLMRLEAMSELFEDQYEQQQDDFTELLECYGGNHSDQPIQNMVMGLYDFIQSSPWPEKWLDTQLKRMDIPDGTDFSQTPWGRVLMDSIRLELTGLKRMVEQALEMLKFAMGLEKYIPLFEEEYQKLNELIQITERMESWDALYEALRTMEFRRLPAAGKDVDKEKQSMIRNIRDTVKAAINIKLKKKLVNARSEDICRDLKVLLPVMHCLARLVMEFSQRYIEKKKRKAVLDFNDLEHLCLKILSDDTKEGIAPSKAALEYREQFEEIMVDEYQDSNMVQEILIRLISRSEPDIPNVFMVGDVKQSIYRFRQAKPELFLEKYNTYSLTSGCYKKIMLFRNFRSRPEVLQAINYIFKQIMSVEAGELDYTDEEALNPGAEFAKCEKPDAATGGPVELHLIQTGDSTASDRKRDDEDNDYEVTETAEEEEILDNIQCEARLVACRILELMTPDEDGRIFHVFDKRTKAYRKVEFRDIVILLRATKNWSDVFLDELSAMGIPAFADTGTGFFRTIEIQVIMSLLQLIDNPLQDIPLLSVLRSPIVSFTTNELVELRLADRNATLFDCLKKLAATHRKTEQRDTPELKAEKASAAGEPESFADRGGKPLAGGNSQDSAQGGVHTPERAGAGIIETEKGNSLITGGSEVLRTAAEKAAKFLEQLKRWREMALRMTTDQLLWYLYHDTGYYGMVGAMPAGEQRQANLRVLYDRARQFEQTSYKGLFNFIHFVDKLKSSRGDMGSAKILGENDNVVRIMSIHKSKGLEFPVVFLSGCGKRFNVMDMNKSVLLHQELGFGPDIVDFRHRISRPSALKKAIREKVRVEALSEEMRILYVAMTRAKEKLILTGSVGNVEKSADKWLNTASTRDARLPAYAMLKSSGYLDWIGPALIRHKNEANGGISLLHYASPGNEYHGAFIADVSRWRIRIWNRNDILSGRISEIREEKEFLGWLDSHAAVLEPSERFRKVKKQLEWNYPFAKVNRVPAKVTVTELKRRFEDELADASHIPIRVPQLVKKPLFLEEEKGLSAAEKGTILHFVMQHLDLSDSDLQRQLDTMVKKDLLTEQQAKTVSLEKISHFLESDMGRRMRSASKLYREIPFNLEIPCHAIFPEMAEENYRNETLLLQGIIDCYFEEQDGLVLLDYKTDSVTPGSVDEIIGKYRIQLDYYTRTLERVTGKKVKERYLYLFSIEQLLEL